MPSLLFRARHRLTHDRQFQAVLGSKSRKTRGTLVFSTLPNALPHARLGLSVGTRVGTAVTRNRCKRLLREAFRLEQHTLPASTTGGYDIVIGVRPGPFPALADCRAALVEVLNESDRLWRRREAGE